MNKIRIPSGEPAGRITCPRCGNTKKFVEVTNNILVTTHFIQNLDGSFSLVEHKPEIMGEVRLFCERCNADISEFHSHLHEMMF